AREFLSAVNDDSWVSRLLFVVSPALLLWSACVDIVWLFNPSCPTGALICLYISARSTKFSPLWRIAMFSRPGLGWRLPPGLAWVGDYLLRLGRVGTKDG